VAPKPAKSCRNRRVPKVPKVPKVIASCAALTTRDKLLGRRAPNPDQHRRRDWPTFLPKPPPHAPCLRCTCSGIAGTARAISSEWLFASEPSLCRAVRRSASLNHERPTLAEQAPLAPAEAAQSAWALVVAEREATAPAPMPAGT